MVDGNTSTIIHTSFSPNLYLDNGYEWLLVELNLNAFQFIDGVSIFKRNGNLNKVIILIYEILLHCFIF